MRLKFVKNVCQKIGRWVSHRKMPASSCIVRGDVRRIWPMHYSRCTEHHKHVTWRHVIASRGVGKRLSAVRLRVVARRVSRRRRHVTGERWRHENALANTPLLPTDGRTGVLAATSLEHDAPKCHHMARRREWLDVDAVKKLSETWRSYTDSSVAETPNERMLQLLEFRAETVDYAGRILQISHDVGTHRSA